jgi:hypothetical protein
MRLASETNTFSLRPASKVSLCRIQKTLEIEALLLAPIDGDDTRLNNPWKCGRQMPHRLLPAWSRAGFCNRFPGQFPVCGPVTASVE